MIRSTIAAALTIALTPVLAHAQEVAPSVAPTDGGMDWTVVRFTEEPTIVATASFDNGIKLIARCMDDVYDVIVGGLPPAPRRQVSREIGLLVGDDTVERMTTWTIGEAADTAFSRVPALVARKLAEGGQVQIIIPPQRRGGPRTRYVMDLTPSSTALERTLTACGRPLVDPRDNDADGNGQDGLPVSIEWVRQPRVEFPAPVRGRMPMRGYVTLTCVIQAEGRLGDCQIESEQPARYNLGKEVREALDTARVRPSREAQAAGRPFEGRLILFTVAFSMS